MGLTTAETSRRWMISAKNHHYKQITFCATYHSTENLLEKVPAGISGLYAYRMALYAYGASYAYGVQLVCIRGEFANGVYKFKGNYDSLKMRFHISQLSKAT